MRGSTVGISDNFKTKNRKHYVLLSFIDTFFSVFVVGPLVITFWRGQWSLMDIYVCPAYPFESATISFLVGILGHYLLTILQRPLTRNFHPERHRLTFYVVSRLYTVYFGFSCVSFWRGAFLYLDIYTGTNIALVASSTALSAVALTVLKTLRNISAPPFLVSMDSCQDYFQVQTMFRMSGEKETSLYVLDCVFSVTVIGSLVVFVWRGAWTILDIYLLPSSPDLSAWGSLVLGYGIVFFTFALQTPMKLVCNRLKGIPRLLVADIYLFLSFCGTVNVWRGIWNLLNIYFIPENLELSYWVTYLVSLLILILLNCSNSILVRGVYIDGEEEGGKCVVFPCYYLRLYFQTKRKERLQQLQLDHLKKQLSVAGATCRKGDAEKGGCVDYPQHQGNSTGNHLQVPLMAAHLALDVPDDG